MAPFPALLLEAQVGLLEGKLTRVWGLGWVCHVKPVPSASSNWSFAVSVLPCHWPQQLPVPMSHDSVSARLPLGFLGQPCALWPRLSEESKKRCRFLVCLAFFLLRGWGRLLSSTCWNGSWKSLNTFLNQVVMYFIASYLKPLEKFRSKEQIISCIRSVYNCLNYPSHLLACGGMWPPVSLKTQPALPGLGFQVLCRDRAKTGAISSRGAVFTELWTGSPRDAESEVPRAQNLGMPDSQALTLYLYSPKKDISLNSAVRVPCLVTLVPAQALIGQTMMVEEITSL